MDENERLIELWQEGFWLAGKPISAEQAARLVREARLREFTPTVGD